LALLTSLQLLAVPVKECERIALPREHWWKWNRPSADSTKGMGWKFCAFIYSQSPHSGSQVLQWTYLHNTMQLPQVVNFVADVVTRICA